MKFSRPSDASPFAAAASASGQSHGLEIRARALRFRIGLALVVGLLAGAATRSPWIVPWLLGVLASGALETELLRRGVGGRLLLASQALTAGAFALIALILLKEPSLPRLGEAIFIAVGAIVGNAILPATSRWSRAALLAPPTLVMVAAIARALEFVAPGTASDAILLVVMAATFLMLSMRLSAAMDNERAALRGANAELEAAENRWRLIFDSSPDALISFDASALHAAINAKGHAPNPAESARRLLSEEDFFRLVRVTAMNRRARTLFGPDVLGARFQPGYFRAFCDALEAIDEDGVLAPFEITLMGSDGSETQLQAHVRQATPPGAAPWSLCLCSYVDISAAHRLARAEAEARQAAEASHRARTDFLAAMSHDIRTPLNGVLGMAQAMAQEPFPAQQRERLGVIRDCGETLSELVDRLTDHAVAPAAGEIEACEAPDPGLRVLAAEDNGVNRMVLKALLEQLSIVPTLVENGEEAVQAWESAPWDLILMDVQMPVMDGPAATMRIRAREAVSGRPRTPIVAVTANTLPHQVESYLAAGMDYVVRKPFSVTELFEAISGALEPLDAEDQRRTA